MICKSRPISWIKATRKDFKGFPAEARDTVLDALGIVAEGGHPLIAKPLTGLGSGILELALKYQGDAFRVVYAVQIDTEIWIIHAFQKKSNQEVPLRKQKSI